MNALTQYFSRYTQYTPLWSDSSTNRKTSHAIKRYTLIATALLAASCILNFWLYSRLAKKWKLPLDNYQHLNDQPIVNSDFLHTLPAPSPEANAVVTSLYTDSFATAVAALGHSLKLANSTASRLLFYLENKVSPQALCIATSSGFVPYPISRIPPPNGGQGVYEKFLDQYSKLNLWALDDVGIKGVVYLDADTLVRGNFDELFSLPYDFAAVPDVYIDGPGFSLGFNAGVLFVRPSRAVFEDMLAKISTAHFNAHEAEQSFLNIYYGADALRLPYVYNANLAIKVRSAELWADVKAAARVVHYTLVKPFLAEVDNSGKRVVEMRKLEENAHAKMEEFGGLFREEIEDWLAVWSETRHTYTDKLAACSNLPAAPIS